MRRLYLLRHAKSDWSTGVSDHARPLNKRGVQSAIAIGRVLGDAGEEPDLIVTSTAVRARSTAELVVEAAGWNTPLVATDDLYETAVSGALDAIGGTRRDVERLMVVGHQPTWSGLIEHLCGCRVTVKTATVVALDTYATWSTLGGGSCTLGFIIHPRMFLGAPQVRGRATRR